VELVLKESREEEVTRDITFKEFIFGDPRNNRLIRRRKKNKIGIIVLISIVVELLPYLLVSRS
jgi:hypothetical protein